MAEDRRTGCADAQNKLGLSHKSFRFINSHRHAYLLLYKPSHSRGRQKESKIIFAGICDRTQQVQDGILNWISGVSDCAKVKTTHLTTVTELTLERCILCQCKQVLDKRS